MKGSQREYVEAKHEIREDFVQRVNEYFGYWHMADPSDADIEAVEKRLKDMGIDPEDWDIQVELGLMSK